MSNFSLQLFLVHVVDPRTVFALQLTCKRVAQRLDRAALDAACVAMYDECFRRHNRRSIENVVDKFSLDFVMRRAVDTLYEDECRVKNMFRAAKLDRSQRMRRKRRKKELLNSLRGLTISDFQCCFKCKHIVLIKDAQLHYGECKVEPVLCNAGCGCEVTDFWMHCLHDFIGCRRCDRSYMFAGQGLEIIEDRNLGCCLTRCRKCSTLVRYMDVFNHRQSCRSV